jgi:hypothetical protein
MYTYIGAREGLMAALDLVATALSQGLPPSVRTFNEILQAYAAAGNPDLPHPSYAYTEALLRCAHVGEHDKERQR